MTECNFTQLDELMRMFEIVIQEKETLIAEKAQIMEEKHKLELENNQLKQQLKQLTSDYNIQVTQLQQQSDLVENRNKEIAEIKNQRYNAAMQNIFKADQLQEQEQIVQKFIEALQQRVKIATVFVEIISFHMLIIQLKQLQHLDICHRFGLKSEEMIDDLVQGIQFSHQFWLQNPIRSIESLRMTLTAIQIIGFGGLLLYFEGTFTFDSIDDETWITIFSSPFWVGGIQVDTSSPGYENMIVLYDFDANKVVRRPQLTESFIQSCQSSVYSAVVDTAAEVGALGQLHLKQLVLTQRGAKTALRLQHPEDLIAAVLNGAVISNLDQCKNILAYSSAENTLTYNQLSKMTRLIIFHSYDDTYEGQVKKGNVLEDVLQFSKPKVVWIQPKLQGHLVTIESNIEQLQQLVYRDLNKKGKLKIDISQYRPQSLIFVEAGAGKYVFSGDKQDIKQAQSQIVQEL